MMKLNGFSIKSTLPLHRIVEIRTVNTIIIRSAYNVSFVTPQVLEKIRPLDQKLKYQIDKLVRTAATGMGMTTACPEYCSLIYIHYFAYHNYSIS